MGVKRPDGGKSTRNRSKQRKIVLAANAKKSESGQPGGKFILTINGGSSSIKFAFFETGSLQRTVAGRVEGIGLAEGRFEVKDSNGTDNFSRSITMPDHHVA